MDEIIHDREALQRILYEIVVDYEQAAYAPVKHVPARRFERFCRKTTLGGDSELLRDSIRIAKIMLKENEWWPNE